MIEFKPGVGLHFKPAGQLDFDFQIQSQVGYVDFDGSESTATNKDAIEVTTNTSYSDPYYDLYVIGATDDVSLSVLDATGSLVGNRVSRVNDGPCRAVASHPLLARTTTLDMSRKNSYQYKSWQSYVTGSLAKHISDQVTALIAGHTAADMLIYSVQNHASSIYTRNVDCWAYPLNLTAVSPWNSRGGQTRAGTAITPRHTLHATHYPVAVSDTLRFVTAGNVVVDRTVEAVYDVPQSAPYQKDIQIALLNSDLPGTITPVKFLPANAYDYLPNWKAWKIPLIYTNQQERMGCALCTAFTGSPQDYIGIYATTESPYATMYLPVSVGDSGSPAFLVINGSPVIVSHYTSAGSGWAHHLMLSEIALAITTLGGGHTLSTVDLSSFPTY